MIPPFLLSPTFIAGALIVALSASNFMFYSLWQGVKDDFSSYESAVETERKILAAEAERAKAESDRVTADVSRAWADALHHSERNSLIRLLPDPKCGEAKLRPISTSASQPDAASDKSGSDPITIEASQCEARLNNAIRDAAQVMWLQEFIKQQAEIKR